MTFEEFVQSEGVRLESYVLRFGRRFSASASLLADMRQEAHLAAFRALPYWKPKSGNKSAFNWCAGPMRRAMEKALRRELGLRPCSTGPIRDMRREYDDARFLGPTLPDMESRLDLQRALVNDRKPAQIMRLIMTALSPMSGADLARDEGISRQAVNLSARRARSRLRLALG
jgi:DNA-directed RNA polymerase specialized sigma24 family protein